MDDVLRIAHGPLAYYRPWAAAAAHLAPPQQSALNAWITRLHDLPGGTVIAPGQARMARRLIQGWQRVPATAWLMACAKHRRSLLGSRHLLEQPPRVHAFLRLGFSESDPAGALLPPEQLLGWGGDHLQQGLRGQIPDWLHARLGLWFVGLPRPAPHRADGAFDMTCFLSAWNHAADLS